MDRRTANNKRRKESGMEYCAFTEKVRRGVADFMGEGFSVELSRTPKNNGVVLCGLLIMKEDSNVSPTIYLEEFYERYEEGESLGGIVREVLSLYEKTKIEGQVDMSFFLDFEQVKSKIVYKLINREDNRELLETIPWKPFLDMAVVFYCNVLHETMGNVTLLVRNQERRLWRVDVDTLYELAQKNTPLLLKPSLTSIWEIIGARPPQMVIDEKGDMYVLSNEQRSYGAASLLYPGVLEAFAKETKEGFYILPSSVHEVLLVSGHDLAYTDCFRDMVREVNASQMSREEVLSNSIYYYDKSERKIKKL